MVIVLYPSQVPWFQIDVVRIARDFRLRSCKHVSTAVRFSSLIYYLAASEYRGN